MSMFGPVNRKILRIAFAFAAVLASASVAKASSFSFTGTFLQDDNVQEFTFVVGAVSNVTLRTWSYAGGTNAAGQVIPSDGFDPILALFSGTGPSAVLVGQNDDGGASVPADAETGAHFDTFLQLSLNPGTYTVSVMQYDNFAAGGTLGAGFSRTGTGNFTRGLWGGGGPGGFYDVTGDQNDGHWAFDVLNVDQAIEVNPNTSAVPEPASMTLLGTGIAALYCWRRRHART